MSGLEPNQRSRSLIANIDWLKGQVEWIRTTAQACSSNEVINAKAQEILQAFAPLDPQKIQTHNSEYNANMQTLISRVSCFLSLDELEKNVRGAKVELPEVSASSAQEGHSSTARDEELRQKRVRTIKDVAAVLFFLIGVGAVVFGIGLILSGAGAPVGFTLASLGITALSSTAAIAIGSGVVASGILFLIGSGLLARRSPPPPPRQAVVPKEDWDQHPFHMQLNRIEEKRKILQSREISVDQLFQKLSTCRPVLSDDGYCFDQDLIDQVACIEREIDNLLFQDKESESG